MTVHHPTFITQIQLIVVPVSILPLRSVPLSFVRPSVRLRSTSQGTVPVADVARQGRNENMAEPTGSNTLIFKSNVNGGISSKLLRLCISSLSSISSNVCSKILGLVVVIGFQIWDQVSRVKILVKAVLKSGGGSMERKWSRTAQTQGRQRKAVTKSIARSCWFLKVRNHAAGSLGVGTWKLVLEELDMQEQHHNGGAS